MTKPTPHRRGHIVLVTPALAQANNGNWQTARRWATLLRPHARVTVLPHWRADEGPVADLMLALHARRSAPSMAAWRSARPQAPLALALTGTDLYRDIDHDASAQAALASADRLLVLNRLAPQRLPLALQAKTQVVLQSCSARQPLTKTKRHLRVLMVGHLRDEKDPLTYLRAAERLAHRPDILLDHIGAALDPALGQAAAALARRQPNYRWLGALPHGQVRRQIQRAHLLVHASRMEGGAQVVIEALRSGTPVLASQIDGNLGLLGPDWPASFAVGDDAALAAALCQARDDAAMLGAWQAQAAQRSPQFSPAQERASLWQALAPWLGAHLGSAHPAERD